jgi:glycosyltransferase involved in cell wall biosynthesis
MGSNPSPTRFNVMIASYGAAPMLRRTLESLARASRPAGFERVLIVENGPPGATESICRAVASRLPVEYTHIPEAGKGRALMRGLDILQNGFVLLFDDDIRVVPEIFEVYAKAIAARGGNTVYGGPVSIDYEVEPPAWLVPYLPQSARGYEPGDPKNPKGTGWFLGANYGVFVERIRDAGGFSSTLGPGMLKAGTEGNPVGNEMDMQARLYKQGCDALYLPEARIWHYVPRDRCTPAWTLHRHYRQSLTRAMAEKPASGRTISGVPPWLWRRVATAGLKALAASVLPCPAARFRNRMDYYRWSGHMQGLRLRDSASRPSPTLPQKKASTA